MKRFLMALLLIGASCSYLYAQEALPAGHTSAPAAVEKNFIWFRYEGDTFDGSFAISSIDWVSASEDQIQDASGFILTDGAGNRIAECVASTVSDQCHFTFDEPVIVDGMTATWLDGSLYVYGKMR